MPKVERTIQIERPVEEVFDLITDPDRAHEWSDTVRSVSADGEVDVGTSLMVEARFLGKSFESTYEVTEYDRPSRYAYTGDRPFKLTMSADLEESDGGTELRFMADVEPGLFFAAAGPLFKRQMKKQIESDMARFKDLAES